MVKQLHKERKINSHIAYGDAKAFRNRYIEYRGNDKDGIFVAFGVMDDDGTKHEESSFKIDSYDLSQLAVTWLDNWHKSTLDWRMRSVPNEVRSIRNIVYSGPLNISYARIESDEKETREEYEAWYERYTNPKED